MKRLLFMIAIALSPLGMAQAQLELFQESPNIEDRNGGGTPASHFKFDFDGNFKTNVHDIQYLVTDIIVGGAPCCAHPSRFLCSFRWFSFYRRQCDVNLDGEVNISDAIALNDIIGPGEFLSTFEKLDLKSKPVIRQSDLGYHLAKRRRRD